MATSPRLRSARALDARIAEKSIAPYLQNTGDEDHETGTSARKVSDRNGPFASDLPYLDTPDFYTPNDESTSHQQQARSDSDIQELAPIPFPETNSGTPAGTGSIADGTARPAVADRIHIVQKGETLSSIAAKELGSAARFQEVFEANPELKNANDVQVGMSLRIPGQRESRPESVSQKTRERPKITPPPLLPDPGRTEIGESRPGSVDPEKQPRRVASEPSIPKKKFEPAKRVPLGAKGMLPQSSEAEPVKPRKLSQLPPGDTGGKVAR
ncbi:MAG: LysM peptidoglycan-binding domain-containing protein [Planctomycetes bacterium]|nr:LysM peptidoglycan-binding domain-containing protein [Planctomycetota bacterium]